MLASKYRCLLESIILWALVALAIFYGIKLFMMIDSYGVDKLLTQNEEVAKWIFFFICFAQPIILPIPEAVTIPAGSAVFGSFLASSIGFLGTIAGVIVMFFIARVGGLKLISKFIKEKHLTKYQSYVRKNETTILALMFIIPILPDEIICVGAGISGVSFKRFFLIAAISKIMTSTLLAYSVDLAQSLTLTIPQLMAAGSMVLGFFLLVSFLVKKLITKEKAEEVNRG